MVDIYGEIERGFTIALIGWGRACKDTLVRNCEWHVARGAELPRACRP